MSDNAKVMLIIGVMAFILGCCYFVGSIALGLGVPVLILLFFVLFTDE